MEIVYKSEDKNPSGTDLDTAGARRVEARKADINSRQKTSCCNCFQVHNCLWSKVAKERLPELDMLVSHRRPFRRGQHVVMAGDKSEGLCLVRSGCLKAYTVNKEGESQITGFYLPGELLCIDDIATGTYPYNIEALDTSSVCIIPLQAVLRVAAFYPSVMQEILKKVSQTMCREHAMMYVLSKLDAKQRLASFLIDISERMNSCRQAGRYELDFSMRRCDIADYLGMATETVSRWLSRFQHENLIQVDHRHITIRDINRLYALINRPTAADFALGKTA